MYVSRLFFAVIFIALLLGGCSKHLPVEVSMSQLTSQPENYVGQAVTVNGYVTQSLGEKSYFLVFFYPEVYMCQQDTDPELESCMRTKMSLSQKRVAEFAFSDGLSEIRVIEETGGLYLPLPVVAAGSPNLPQGELQITGTWTEDKDGFYRLLISEVSPQ